MASNPESGPHGSAAQARTPAWPAERDHARPETVTESDLPPAPLPALPFLPLLPVVGEQPSELLPCPFCDGDAGIGHKPAKGYWLVLCRLVGCCYGPKADTEAEAIAAWNRRSSPRGEP